MKWIELFSGNLPDNKRVLIIRTIWADNSKEYSMPCIFLAKREGRIGGFNNRYRDYFYFTIGPLITHISSVSNVFNIYESDNVKTHYAYLDD